ncbi:MAG: DUF2490 domain-containing protein [Armatimonadota bacterium]
MALCASALLYPLRPACAYDTDSQLWTQFTFNGRYTNGMRIFAEVQPRQGDNFARFSQLIVRPAIGYQVTRKMSLWIGYGWTPSFLPEFNNEHRVFQQMLFEDSYQGVGLTNRTRFEQRSIEGAGGTSLRLRHLIRASQPLDRQQRWAAVASNELFVNLNSTPSGPQSGFDQDRFYLGGAYNVNRHTRLELGYLASFINPPRNRPDRRLDVLLFTVNYNL